MIDYVTASTPHEDRWVVPEGWTQGRGAWGGLVIAAMIRAAAGETKNAAQQLRSVTCQLLAPVPAGAVTLQSTVLRTGSATTGTRVDVVDDAGAVLATLTGVWGADRVPEVEPAYAMWGVVERPAAAHWSEVPVVAISPPLGPEFGAHLVFRPITGFPGHGTARTLGWITPAVPVQSYDAAALVGMVDAWWPSALAVLADMRPMATISFSAHLMQSPAAIDAHEPLLHEGFVTKAESGFSSEVRRLWAADGSLVVDSMQSLVIIR